MTIQTIADTYNIPYIILYEECPAYIMFTADNTIRLIEKIQSECYPICFIGVDEETKGKYDFNCSWECLRDNNETMPNYTKRSCSEAVEFVEKVTEVGSKLLFEIDIFDFSLG